MSEIPKPDVDYIVMAKDALKGGSNDYAQAYAMVSIAESLIKVSRAQKEMQELFGKAMDSVVEIVEKSINGVANTNVSVVNTSRNYRCHCGEELLRHIGYSKVLDDGTIHRLDVCDIKSNSNVLHLKTFGEDGSIAEFGTPVGKHETEHPEGLEP